MATETTKAWSAGIVDGEGWLGWKKNGHGNKKNPAVEVHNTDEVMCRVLYEQWGGWFHYVGKRKDRPNSKPIWIWRTSGKKCISFLTEIEPYLVTKKTRARELLNG